MGYRGIINMDMTDRWADKQKTKQNKNENHRGATPNNHQKSKQWLILNILNN